MGAKPITPSMLTSLRGQINCAWLAALILADGEVSYMSAPVHGRWYYRARVRIGMYDPEPVAKAAVLMGVSLMGPRKGRYEAESQGSRAVAVIARILPYIVGRKTHEALYILNHGGRVEKRIYREFQRTFPSLRRRQGKLAWKNGAPGGNARATPFEFASPTGAPVKASRDQRLSRLRGSKGRYAKPGYTTGAINRS